MEYYSYCHDEILQWMTRSLKPPPEQPSPAPLRGGGLSNGGGVGGKQPQATPIDQGTSQKQPAAPMLNTKLSSAIAAAHQQGQSKREELRRQYGMDAESARRTLDFDEEVDDDMGMTCGKHINLDDLEDNSLFTDVCTGAGTGTGTSPPETGGSSYKVSAFTCNSAFDDGTVLHSNVSRTQSTSNDDTDNLGTPEAFKPPENPYNTGQTPLTDKYFRQCYDFYLQGRLVCQALMSSMKSFTRYYLFHHHTTHQSATRLLNYWKIKLFHIWMTNKSETYHVSLTSNRRPLWIGTVLWRMNSL
jgi:hypothetical protein